MSDVFPTVKDFIESNSWIVPVLIDMLGGDVTISAEDVANFGEGMTLMIHDTADGLRFVKMPIEHAQILVAEIGGTPS